MSTPLPSLGWIKFRSLRYSIGVFLSINNQKLFNPLPDYSYDNSQLFFSCLFLNRLDLERALLAYVQHLAEQLAFAYSGNGRDKFESSYIRSRPLDPRVAIEVGRNVGGHVGVVAGVDSQRGPLQMEMKTDRV